MPHKCSLKTLQNGCHCPLNIYVTHTHQKKMKSKFQNPQIDASQFSPFCRWGCAHCLSKHLNGASVAELLPQSMASECIVKLRPTYYKMLMEITCCLFTSLQNPFFGVLCGSINILLTEVFCLAFCCLKHLLRCFFFFPENDANTWQPSLSANHSSVWFHQRIAGDLFISFVTVFMLHNIKQASLAFLYMRSFILFYFGPFQNYPSLEELGSWWWWWWYVAYVQIKK